MGEQKFQSAVDDVPVLSVDRHLTVTGSNALAQRLGGLFVPGANLARYTYLDGDWDLRCLPQEGGSAPRIADALKLALEVHGEDAGFRSLIGELSALSREFSRAWADAVPVLPSSVDVDVEHQRVGSLRFRCSCEPETGGSDRLLLVLRPRDAATRRGLDELGADASL